MRCQRIFQQMEWIWSRVFCSLSQRIGLEPWTLRTWWHTHSSRVLTSRRSVSNCHHNSSNWPLFRKRFVNISPKIWKLGRVNCPWEKFFLLRSVATSATHWSQPDKAAATTTSSKSPRSTQQPSRYPNLQHSKEPLKINNCLPQRTNIPCQIVANNLQHLPKVKEKIPQPLVRKLNTYSQTSTSFGRQSTSFQGTVWNPKWFYKRSQRRNQIYYFQANVK